MSGIFTPRKTHLMVIFLDLFKVIFYGFNHGKSPFVFFPTTEQAKSKL